MWLVDSIYEYMEMGADFFMPVSHKIVDDSVLGLLVVALGLVIWAAYQRIISFSAVARKYGIFYNKSVINKR